MTKTQDDAAIKVLLVEDDADHRGLVAEFLSESATRQFDIHHSPTVEQALHTLHGEPFEVVLLDLSLPDGTGLDALQRARVAATSVPIIVMTTSEDENLAVRALRAGAQDYLVKGKFESQHLVRTVLNALERHRLMRDLEEARRHQHHLATHDALTGLYNRSALEANLDRVMAYARRNRKSIALFFIDLDGFKAINDSLGHAVGDEILKEVGTRIRAAVRVSDMAARLGGDEFIVMLQDLGRGEDAMLVAQKFHGFLSQPFKRRDQVIELSASIGIAFFPGDGTDPEALIRNADAAMYHAKGQGKGRVSFFSSSMNQELQERLQLEGRLRRALEEQQLLLYYQPVWKGSTPELVAAEALLRWREPGCDVRAPEDFILVAEASGLIVPIGEWVLETACAQWRERDRQDLERLALAVNLSAKQLTEQSILMTIRKILDKTGLSPNRLQLELTETAMLPDEKTVGRILDELHELGIGLTLDDFGTGHSSLGRLRRHPFDRIKIDRSFVKDLPDDREAAGLVTAMLAMGQALGLSVVAEGVETEEQHAFLVEQGCDEFQGFLLGRPVPPEELGSHPGPPAGD